MIQNKNKPCLLQPSHTHQELCLEIVPCDFIMACVPLPESDCERNNIDKDMVLEKENEKGAKVGERLSKVIPKESHVWC